MLAREVCRRVYNGSMSESLSIDVEIDRGMNEAIEAVTAALKKEGFGVLTRIDVDATLKQKIDVDFRPYVILGACNPALAHRALCAKPEAGLLLPCNVTVEQTGGNKSLVRIINARQMMQFGGIGEDAELREVGTQADERLRRVAASLSGE
jgi:uncharacterized protein (DUF302 family)